MIRVALGGPSFSRLKLAGKSSSAGSTSGRKLLT